MLRLSRSFNPLTRSFSSYSLPQFPSFATFFLTMSGNNPYDVPAWLWGQFDDPIWQQHQGPWRRHSDPGLPDHDDFAAGSSQLRETESEPGEPRGWRIPWSVVCEKPPTAGAGPVDPGRLDGSFNKLQGIMDLLADPYWAGRGWVLCLINRVEGIC